MCLQAGPRLQLPRTTTTNASSAGVELPFFPASSPPFGFLGGLLWHPPPGNSADSSNSRSRSISTGRLSEVGMEYLRTEGPNRMERIFVLSLVLGGPFSYSFAHTFFLEMDEPASPHPPPPVNLAIAHLAACPTPTVPASPPPPPGTTHIYFVGTAARQNPHHTPP